MGIIYRALVEMGADISDVKKMLAKFLYSTFADKNIKALPGAVDRTIDPNDISNHIREQMNDSSLGIRDPYLSGEIELDPDEGENSRSEEHTSELQSRGHLVCRLLLEKK